MKLVRLFSLVVLVWMGFASFSSAQVQPKKGASGKYRARFGEKFDFVFNRTVLIPVGMADSVAMDPTRSSSTFLGISFNMPLGGKKVALKAEPGVNWQRITYDGSDPEKYFPRDAEISDFLWERHRGIFLEMALGIRLNLLRNVDDKVRLFTEFGGSGGILVASEYRRRAYSATNGRFYTERFHQENSLRPYRYGGYLRFGNNFVSLYAYYRLSDVYVNGKYNHPDYFSTNPRMVDYPDITPLEIGLTIMF